jgi:hypothetical protein
VAADEADGARGGELHAGLAKCISGREVVLRVNLNGEHALTPLDTGSRPDVFAEGTSHALGDTVCTSTGCLLVFTKHVVREGVDPQGVALSTGLLSDGGVGDHTSRFEGRVSDLDIVVSPQFNANRKLTRFRSTSVPDVELVDTVVGHTTDVLTTGVGGPFQTTVHHCWFSCHRYPSKHACDRCALYHISAKRIPSHSHPVLQHFGQSLHDGLPPASSMADGWRRLLEEESEHQWLSMAAFLVFVLLGAFAIGATEHFVGAGLVDEGAAHAGGLVVDIAYHDDGAYTALVYSPEAGYHLFTEDRVTGEVISVYSPQTDDRGADVRFLKTMPNDEVLFSVKNNQVVGILGNTMVTYEYPTTNGNFGVLDVAEHESTGGTQRLLLTQEGANTSVRGVVGMNPTHAMSTSLGVQWHAVEAYSEGLWMALGSHHSTAGADGSSPATPQARPVLGWIAWDGTNTTPVVQKVQTYDGGVFHSLAPSNGAIIIGGTTQSLAVHSAERVEVLDAPSSHVVRDSDGTVWFIGALGDSTVHSYDGVLSTHVLGRPVPVDQSAVGSSGDFVYVHGVDEEGEPIQWGIDIQANGSIESGRGFLNLLYLLVGAVVLGTMLRYAWVELRRPT